MKSPIDSLIVDLILEHFNIESLEGREEILTGDQFSDLVKLEGMYYEEVTKHQKLGLVKTYLTYDDVNIVPKFSEVLSRENVDLSTRFTKNTTLSIPIVSSPMDTVTELNIKRNVGHGWSWCYT